MTLTFTDQIIPGTHGEPKYSPWDYQLQINTQFGAEGSTVLVGKRTSREIRIESWIHADFTDQNDLINYLKALSEKFGTHGTLKEIGLIGRTTKDCMFIDFEQHQGPIPSNELGWFAIGSLIFRQLRPSE